MFALFAFVTLVLLLVAAIGLPYKQSWYGRWTGGSR
jgi:hypothetical protein